MPLYDQVCDSCGQNEALCRVDEREVCQICGNVCTLLPTMFSIQGIVFSNAQEHGQLGVTWETNKQKREWKKQHPNAVELHKGTTEEKQFNWNMKQQMHDSLAKQGMSYSQYKKASREGGRRDRINAGKEEAKITVDSGTAK